MREMGRQQAQGHSGPALWKHLETTMKIVPSAEWAVARMSCALTGANARSVAVTTAKWSDTAENYEMNII